MVVGKGTQDYYHYFEAVYMNNNVWKFVDLPTRDYSVTCYLKLAKLITLFFSPRCYCIMSKL